MDAAFPAVVHPASILCEYGKSLMDGFPTEFPSGAFVFKKPGLAFHTAAIAGERTVGSDDSMARHHNTDRIRTVGQADGSDSSRPADLLGKVRIRSSRAA